MVILGRTRAFCGCTALALCTLFILTASADLPELKQPSSQPKWPAPYPYAIGAGIQGLASGSTDIVVADVLTTNPSKEPEGGSDNVKFKVVQALMGRPIAGDTLDLYYHLLWTDEKMLKLEPPKFEQGKRYVVFLQSHILDHGGRTSVEYELADQWLSVMPQRPRQMEEIAAAIRVAHGDTRSAWSEPLGPLKGRLVAYRNTFTKRAPIIAVYLELRNVAGGDNTVQVDLSGANFTWEVKDENRKPVAPAASLGSEAKPLLDQKIILEAHASARLPLSQTNSEMAKDRSGYLSIVPGQGWVFEPGDKATYFLSGKVDIPSHGTIYLPKVAIPLD